MSKGNKTLLKTAEGAGIICGICLISVLLFALAIKIFSISSSVIKPVNTIIKAAAITLGCIFSVCGEKGYLKGALTGVIGVAATFLLFSAIGGELSLSWKILLELLFGGIVGAIGGIIAVNIRK